MSKKAAKVKSKSSAKSSSKASSASVKKNAKASKTPSKSATKSVAKKAAVKKVEKKTLIKKTDKPIEKATEKVASRKTEQKVKTKENKKHKNSEHSDQASVAQPSLMTRKGRTIVEEVESLNETETGEDLSKVEKISKIKPIRVERGNLTDEKAKWAEVNRKYGKEKAPTYKMSESFSAMSPIQHKVLGWGFVLTNENDRLEVLFETGIRMLISNYKSS